MNIISYSREQIQQGLAQAASYHETATDDIRLIFTPTRINHDNFLHACDIYSRIKSSNYETVVIVESFGKMLDAKLLVPSKKHFETPLGSIVVNDSLRNGLFNADDRFVIGDGGFSRDMSLFQQMMILQCACDDFSILSVQVADGQPGIVKKFASVLEELLASRNALLVCCCSLDNVRNSEFSTVTEILQNRNRPGLMNYLNCGESKIEGTASFITGVLIALGRDLDLNFLNNEYEDYKGNLLTAYAERQAILQQ